MLQRVHVWFSLAQLFFFSLPSLLYHTKKSILCFLRWCYGHCWLTQKKLRAELKQLTWLSMMALALAAAVVVVVSRRPAILEEGSL